LLATVRAAVASSTSSLKASNLNALKSAANQLQIESRYSSVTKAINPYSVLVGGINVKDDLEGGHGVDPETFAALNVAAYDLKRNPLKGDKTATFAFHDWIRTSLFENKPYDLFVREVLTATGEAGKNPPVAWYREVKDQAAQVEDTAQLFLGLRIQCARCHHHPFEKWSQQDYYGFTAFFSQVGRKKGDKQNEERIFHRVGQAQARNPKTGKEVPITPRRVLIFRPSNIMKDRINDGLSGKDAEAAE